MKIFTAFLAVAALLFSGCSTSTTRTRPHADIGRYRHIFVEHRLTDGRGLDEMIAAQLRTWGYDASAGPLTMMPQDTELILSYVDTWRWDFNTYLISLDVRVRAAGSDEPMAIGHAYKPSRVFGSSPQNMVSEVLGKIFPKRENGKSKGPEPLSEGHAQRVTVLPAA